MGEKETAAAKASGGKQVEEQRWVQDDTPDGETGLEAGKASGGKKAEEEKMQPGGGGGGAAAGYVGKSTPELMLRSRPGGQQDSTPAQASSEAEDQVSADATAERLKSAAMSSIQNIR